ncbi:MAG: tetratricopeptide repeat protein [Spirochaetaceae bacterium]|nr:tetratricopeptide repeat protein [Spirochaetaceae bacterium]
MKLLKNKVSAIFFITVLVFLFFSCTSSAVSIPSENRRILENLAVEYYNIAEAYLEQKNYKKAMEFYDRAMQESSLYQQAYYKKGYAAALAKDWVVAEEIYRNLVAQDPQNVNIAISLAYVVAQSGKLQEALEMYSALNESNPYNQLLAEDCIVLYIALEQFDQAEVAIEKFKVNFPESEDVATKLTEQLQQALSASNQEVETQTELVE